MHKSGWNTISSINTLYKTYACTTWQGVQLRKYNVIKTSNLSILLGLVYTMNINVNSELFTQEFRTDF